MLGMMQNKGGGQNVQPQGGNPGLAAMFRNNAPAAPGMGGVPMLPQIMAPQMPNIGLPPRLSMPIQASSGQAVKPGFARALAAANEHMAQSSTVGRIRNDANGMPRYFGTGGRNAR